MRLVSQDGTIDVPYEQILLERRYYEYDGKRKRNIIFAYTLGPGGSYYAMASYESPENAEKAMALLHCCYRLYMKYIHADSDTKKVLLTSDLSDTIKKKGMTGTFQFPTDTEIENTEI